MTPLPLAAFPIGANTTKSSGFAIAVLIGLAVFITQHNKTVSHKSA